MRVAYGLKERDMDKYANERGKVVVFPVNEVVGVLCLAGHTNCVCVCVRCKPCKESVTEG